MKSQKGVTLISLAVYVILLLIVVTVLSTISAYFFKNYIDTSKKIETLTQFTKFTTFFSEESNKKNIRVLLCNTEEKEPEGKTSYIVFSNNVQYTFIKANKSIYRNKVKICRSIEDCTFSVEDNHITVNMQIQGETEPKSITYTLKN